MTQEDKNAIQNGLIDFEQEKIEDRLYQEYILDICCGIEGEHND